jgi:RNA polymerase sigma-70 factor (ECF subfamily)
MTALTWIMTAAVTMPPSERIVNDTDRHDIEAAQGGDPDAFARLVRRYQQPIAQRLWRFTRDRTVLEELVQESFVQAWMSLAKYRADAPLLHWLMRIATRVGYRHWKSDRRRRETHEQRPAESLAAHDPPSPHEAAEYVDHWLAQLPPRDRLVLMLTIVEGCTVAETAEQTGWSQSMVKVQAHRARAKLRKLMEQTEQS